MKVTSKGVFPVPSGRTHAITGALTGGTMMIFTQSPPEIIIAATIGALLPDLDHKHSILGRYFFLWLFFKHRGFTHSLTCWAAVTLLGVLLFGPLWGVGMSTGYLSHLMLDFIPLLRPRRRKRNEYKRFT